MRTPCPLKRIISCRKPSPRRTNYLHYRGAAVFYAPADEYVQDLWNLLIESFLKPLARFPRFKRLFRGVRAREGLGRAQVLPPAMLWPDVLHFWPYGLMRPVVYKWLFEIALTRTW